MKNAMKKLMSVLLVAVLLISAVPFAASADDTNHSVTVVIKYGDSELANKAVTITDGETCQQVMSWVANNAGIDLSKYDVLRYYWVDEYNSGEVEGSATILGDGTLSVRLTEKVVEEPTTTPTETPSEPVATEPAVEAVKFVVKVSKKGEANTGDIVYESSKVPSNGVSCKVGDLLNYCWNSKWTGVYEFDHAWSKSKNATTYDKDSAIAAGDEVHIMLKPVSKKHDNNSNNSNNSGSNNSGITNKDNTNQVWLHVYINGNASTIAKSIKLNGTYLLDDDGTNTTEIKNYLLTNYYKSSDTSKNVELDGLYVNLGNSGTFPQNYYTDNKVETLNNISEKLNNGYVHINVMLKNVTAKTTTTTTADSSNPKTGDSIYTAMTIMGISAASLAAVMYVYNKKRQAI